MKKQKKVKDNSERYLLTYADMMNLLLILFIVLFASCSKDMVKVNTVMSALAEGFGGSASSSSASVSATATSSGTGTGSANSSGTGNSSIKDDSLSNDYNQFYAELIALLNKNNIKDKVEVVDTQTQVIITLKDNVLFASGKADLDTDATDLLTSIAGMLNKVSYGQLIIEGHTDSDPIHTARFRDNTELSLIRAYTVCKIFTDSGIDPKLVLPAGYGENYPVAPNDTAENKSKNRRVVITILKRGLTPADSTATMGEISQRIDEISKSSSSSSSSSSESK